MTRLSEIEKIKQFYRGRTDKLTDKENERRLRIESAHSLLLKPETESEVAKTLQRRYGVTGPQSYQDVRDALHILGDAEKTSREAYRKIVYELSIKTYKRAEEEDDVNGMNRAVKNMIDLLGLNKDEPLLPNAGELGARTFVVNLQINSKNKKSYNIDLSNIHRLPSETRDMLMKALEPADLTWKDVLDADNTKGESKGN